VILVLIEVVSDEEAERWATDTHHQQFINLNNMVAKAHWSVGPYDWMSCKLDMLLQLEAELFDCHRQHFKQPSHERRHRLRADEVLLCLVSGFVSFDIK
jgi:hypothetical protein